MMNLPSTNPEGSLARQKDDPRELSGPSVAQPDILSGIFCLLPMPDEDLRSLHTNLKNAVRSTSPLAELRPAQHTGHYLLRDAQLEKAKQFSAALRHMPDVNLARTLMEIPGIGDEEVTVVRPHVLKKGDCANLHLLICSERLTRHRQMLATWLGMLATDYTLRLHFEAPFITFGKFCGISTPASLDPIRQVLAAAFPVDSKLSLKAAQPMWRSASNTPHHMDEAIRRWQQEGRAAGLRGYNTKPPRLLAGPQGRKK